MKSRSAILAERSQHCALGAIEIYNKPQFFDREQAFIVLLAIAWEALLKARVLQLNHNKLTSLFIKDGGRYKRNRTGGPLTISIGEALKRLTLDRVVVENIDRLTEIRDAAVHMTAHSEVLPYLVYSLGAASLSNYARLAKEWFDFKFSDYDLFILPLGFSYPFRSLHMADVAKEPEDIQHILKSVVADQDAGTADSGDFHLVCEIETRLISAKKITTQADITAAIAQGAQPGVTVLQKAVNLLDRYTLSYSELWIKVKGSLPNLKQGAFNKALKDLKIKGDAKYAAYSYRTKADQAKGPRASTAVIYNDEAVKLLVAHLSK